MIFDPKIFKKLCTSKVDFPRGLKVLSSVPAVAAILKLGQINMILEKWLHKLFLHP